MVAGDEATVLTTFFFDQVAAFVVAEVAVAVELQAVASADITGTLTVVISFATENIPRRIKLELFAGVAFYRL